jgi:hypothetical protein
MPAEFHLWNLRAQAALLLGMTEKSEPTSSTVRQIKVAVAGGTGRIGRYVVASLRRNGAEPVVLARSQGIDVVSGAGLASALPGVDAVIDVTDVASNRRSVQMAFFEQATKNLLDMVRRFLRRQRLRRILLPVRLPGPAGRAIADGALLPRAPGRRGVQTFADWLATPLTEPWSG